MSSVFFDTNVWLPAVLTRGFTRRLVTAAELQGTVFISSELVDEVVEKLALKFQTSWETIRDAKAWMRKIGRPFSAAVAPFVESPDPDDAILLAQAVAAGCEHFVTNDKPLLKLGVIREMKIIRPGDFATLIGVT